MAGEEDGTTTLGMPTIVQVCTRYVNLAQETGGVSNSVREICLGLEARGIKTIVVCGNRQRGAPAGPTGHFQVSPFLEMFVVAQRGHPLLGPTGQVRECLGSVREPWMGHVHTCFSALTEAAMGHMRRKGIPYIFTPRGKLSPEFLSQHRFAKRLWWMLCARRAVKDAATIAVQSRGESRGWSSLGLHEEFRVVPNGYRRVGSIEHSPTQSRTIDEPYIMFLGPLDPRKQPDFLVRAYAKSRVRLSHKLVIVGPDSYGYRGRVVDAIDRLKLQDRVVLFGPAYGAEKWRLLSQARCLCLPSRAEGFPLVLCEALGAGLPMIISRECNFAEAADAGAAVQVEGPEESAWACAIDTVCLNDGVHCTMMSAALRLAEGYTWEHVIDMWVEVYRSLAREQAAG